MRVFYLERAVHPNILMGHVWSLAKEPVMRIINTNVKLRTKNAKLQLKIPSFKFLIVVFTFLLSSLLTGCAQISTLNQAQDYLRQSQVYYQRAITLYKDLIAKGEDLDRLRFELGRLYYNNGDFKQAIEGLKNTGEPLAKKFLAISYYRLGNFTDALEVFNQNDMLDDEYLYYYGLTCEKLNLFDRALEIYKKIKAQDFAGPALERTNIIDKLEASTHIKDISPQVDKILANAPSEEQYPQAGALILYCDEKIEITPQNSQVSYLHYVIKILNERGKVDFSETQIDYDSTYEKVELEYARTLKPDGSVVEVGSRHIRDVSKYLNFPLYSNVRACIISFPEITEGASIEYKLKIYRSQLINKKDFIISYPLQTSEPIIEANFIIDLPKEKTLHTKALNAKYNNFGANLNPDVKERDGNLIYSWHFKDIPQIIPESNMPSSVEINPTLLISTFSSWQEIYDWWWALAEDKIKIDTAIKDKVSQLIQGLSSTEEKIRAIYNFCAQKIRYVAVEYGQAGYEPHNASDIFKNKYGDCKDQAILLVTMLKEAGISSWPVLIPTKDCYNLDEEFPAIFFNHCIACVSLNDKLFFLDPTAETCSFDDLPAGDQDRQVLIIKSDGYKIQKIPLYPAQHNLIEQHLNMKVNTDETINVEKSIFTYGIYDQAQRFWLLYTPPELIEETLKEKIQEISIGAKLDSYKIENLNNLNTPVVLSYALKGPEYFTVAGILRIMPQLTGLDTSMVAKDKRKYAIDFGILDSKETNLEIELPDNFAIKYMPESINKDSHWLRLEVQYNQKDNKIIFNQKMELKKNIILESEYPDFKNFFEDLAKQIKQRIVLEKIK
jgi:hypothetical protein